MEKTLKIIVPVLALTALVGLSGNDAFGWGFSFPGGGLWSGNEHGGVSFHGGGAEWGYHSHYHGGHRGGHKGGSVAFPGGGAWWGYGGHGGVGINVPGFNGYFGW